MSEWLLLFTLIGLTSAKFWVNPFLAAEDQEDKTTTSGEVNSVTVTEVTIENTTIGPNVNTFASKEDKEDQNIVLRKRAGDAANPFLGPSDNSEEKTETTVTIGTENPGNLSDESEEKTTTTRTTVSITSPDLSTGNCNFQRLYNQVSGELKALTEMTEGIVQIIDIFKKKGHKGIEKLSDFMEVHLTEWKESCEELKPLVATIKKNLPKSSIKIKPDTSSCVKVRDSFNLIHHGIQVTTLKTKKYLNGKGAAPKGQRGLTVYRGLKTEDSDSEDDMSSEDG